MLTGRVKYTDMNRESVMSSGENPRAEPAREGELPGDGAETDDQKSVRSKSSPESSKPKRKKPRHRQIKVYHWQYRKVQNRKGYLTGDGP